MRALNIKEHKTNLTNILIDIYKDSLLGSVLGFKGGTAAMLFYDLPRFSVDLDFDLLQKCDENSSELDKIVENMTNLLSRKYTIKDQSRKYNTLFWLVSYGKFLANIKVEISTRDVTLNHYNLKPFYGVNIKVMDIGDMISHKMIALMDRKIVANRDLFDVHYFLSSSYVNTINYNIVKDRTGKEVLDFYKDLYNFVENLDSSTILNGLGEVLDESQKDWAKAKLKIELLGLIERQIDINSNSKMYTRV
jgi:predicted nucleotidyltransferase component of viral defense system